MLENYEEKTDALPLIILFIGSTSVLFVAIYICLWVRAFMNWIKK